MTDHKDEESNDEGGKDEGEDEEGMICDGVGNALPLISLKKCTATQSGGVGDDWLFVTTVRFLFSLLCLPFSFSFTLL